MAHSLPQIAVGIHQLAVAHRSVLPHVETAQECDEDLVVQLHGVTLLQYTDICVNMIFFDIAVAKRPPPPPCTALFLSF